MNTYSWLESDSFLKLVHQGKSIFQIDPKGVVYGPAPRLTSLEDDAEKKGFILVIDENGNLLRSPHTVQSIGNEINSYLSDTQTSLRSAVQDVQKGDEIALNKIVQDLNLSLSNFQQTKKKDTDHIWSKLDPLQKAVDEIKTKNQYLMIMTILLALMTIGLSYTMFRKS